MASSSTALYGMSQNGPATQAMQKAYAITLFPSHLYAAPTCKLRACKLLTLGQGLAGMYDVCVHVYIHTACAACLFILGH